MRVPGFRRRARPGNGPATDEQPGSAPADQGPEGAAAQAQPARPPEAKPARPPTVEERLDGLRIWAGQLERKLGVRTYAAAAGLVIAIAAAAVALVLVLQLREDAATEDDVSAITG